MLGASADVLVGQDGRQRHHVERVRRLSLHEVPRGRGRLSRHRARRPIRAAARRLTVVTTPTSTPSRRSYPVKGQARLARDRLAGERARHLAHRRKLGGFRSRRRILSATSAETRRVTFSTTASARRTTAKARPTSSTAWAWTENSWRTGPRASSGWPFPNLGDSSTGEADWNGLQFSLLYRF